MKKLSLLLLFVMATFSLLAQGPAKKKKTTPNKKKTYAQVITDSAITSNGLFTTHIVDGKNYFEIPDAILEKEILVVTRISGFVKNLNFGGAGVKSRPQQVIRWQKKDNKILLRSVSYNSVASHEDPIYKSVKNNNFEPVIMVFNIITKGKKSSVIQADPLFITDIPMLGGVNNGQRKRFGIKGLDSKRSYISSMRAFPKNVEIKHVLTYKGGDKLPDNRVTGTLSIEMNQSFITLPEVPMQSRYYDARVGYFSLSQTNYSSNEQRTEKQRLITRWRLEPKDPRAYARGELVEPKKPIVYYIDPATPKKWIPYLIQGVNDWQSAFEKAGFKNAIYAREAPTKAENPDWSPEDTRYSVIRYITTDIQNAQGPHVHDPRTGEILESDIMWYHNILRLLRNWYFIHTAAVNPEARGVNFKDEIMGQLVRFVAAHEVGHTLGLPHNMGASVAYSVDSLRSPGFCQRMGTAPSIMDYARFNYVAQPEDGAVGLYPKIGPYDDWSIIYGYKLIPTAKNKDAERPILNQWIKERANNPIYRFGRQRGLPLDPTAQTEDLGDNSMYASELGIKNLKRIVPMIEEWSFEDGKDYNQIKDLYGQVFKQFRLYIGHVTANIGGVIEISKTQDQRDAVYNHVNREQQIEAMEFLEEYLFQTPEWLINQPLARKIEADGMVNRIKALQSYGLTILFNKNRLNRMSENEALNGETAYSVFDLFTDTRRSIFSYDNNYDLYGRNLQRLFVQKMESILALKESSVEVSDIKSAARATLYSVKKSLRARKQFSDMQQMHERDLKKRIEKILEN